MISNENKLDEQSMRDKFGEILYDMSIIDPKVYALDGDLANSTKINIIAEENPAKFLQMGIAEQNMIGVSAGLASVGLQPWATTFAAFISKRALDQIQVSVAQTNLDVKLIGAYAGLLNGRAGKTHQALEDIAIMRTLVNMVVLSPADEYEVEQVVRFANEYNGPVYIRLSRDKVETVFTKDSDYKFSLGTAVVLNEGTDAGIISTGTQTARALRAAKALKQEGYNIAVLHVPSIKPIDKEAIIQIAKKTGCIVTTEEHSIYGGLGSAVSEVIAENYPVPLLQVAVKDQNTQSASNEELLNYYGLSTSHIIEKVKQAIQLKM